MRTRRCIESLGGACSLFPPKSAGLVALGNSSGALEGGLHAQQHRKREMQSVLKSAVSGETRKGSAHIGQAHDFGKMGAWGRAGAAGNAGNARRQRSEGDSGGYAEARAWRGMRERSRRRAENAWKGPWGKLSFSGKLRGKRFRNSI